MRDVLGADRLLGEPALKCGAEGVVAVCLQQLVQPLDFGDSCARPTMGELGQIRERRGPEIDQMLPL